MAKLRREDGVTLTNLDEIQAELAPLSIRLASWPTPSPSEGPTAALLAKPSLDATEKEAVLRGLDHYFERLRQSDGYQTRDLIVLNPDVPKLDEILAKFDRCHRHDDVEVRYIVDGDGSFGFVRPDGSQVLLTVEAGEYINVPAGTEHWFVLTAARRIKAVRYFTTMEGWVPRYSETAIRV